MCKHKANFETLTLEEINLWLKGLEQEKQREKIDNAISVYTIKAADLSCEVDALRVEMDEVREHLKSIWRKYDYVKHERDKAFDFIHKLELTREII